MELRNPPIIEALVEIKWELKTKTPAGYIDPNYQFLLGTFRDKLKDDYPFHEPLPASAVPDEISGGAVKHRFRVAQDDWPVVQIGPGIITVNETKKYKTFDHFKPKVKKVVEALFESYAQPEELQISSLLLRYIDATEFDYTTGDVCEFLTEKMHIPSQIPQFLLLPGKIDGQPMSYSLNTSFRCTDPPGVATLVVDTGHKLKQRAIIWNQIVESSGQDVPSMPEGFESWLDGARDVIHTWFQGIINGPLEEEFSDV